MLKTRFAVVVLAGTVLSCTAFASDDHGHAAPAAQKDDHSPAAKPHDAPAETAKPKRRPARLKTTKEQAEPAHEKKHDAETDSHAPAKTDAHEAHIEASAGPKDEAQHVEPSDAKQAHNAAESRPSNADAALAALVEGNTRWLTNTVTSPNTDSERRSLQAAGQTPFVTILTCADSRVPAERVFDRGVGEIFTVRVAGNVVGDREAGTIEYGLGHLHTGLLVVMGHSKCGAVKACIDGAHNGALHGKVRDLVASIEPSVERAKRNNPTAQADELLNLAVKENVWQGVYNLIAESEEIRTLVSTGEVKVVGAVYDIQSGKVEFLGEHPWQRELITAMNAASPAHSATADAHATDAHEPASKPGH
jgi:carbonic anhydrase